MMLVQEAGERFIIESFCPHQGHSLEHASIQSEQIYCPLHDYVFDIKTGALLSYTEEVCRGLKCYELIYRGNELGVIL